MRPSFIPFCLLLALCLACDRGAGPPAGSEPLNKARLVEAAKRGGDYLVRMQKPDGSFHYSYDPLEDRVSTKTYNIVRHAGTACSLFELFAATRDARYSLAARRALTFLKTRFRPHDGGGLYVLDDDGKAKLGAAGLALIALAMQIELDPKHADDPDARRLAGFITAMQHEDGSFESYHRLKGDEPAGSVSLYYPGEAILGLVRLFRINGDERLLDAARRGADHLIRSQQAMSELPADAWLMQALESLYGLRPEKKYADHALALAESMIATQYGESAPRGYAGGFGPGVPRTTPAASRSEGMLAAYRLARAIGDGRATRIAEALDRAARFQLSNQFDRDNSARLPNPERAAGGFRASAESARIRIDFVQHNISSLLGIAETLH